MVLWDISLVGILFIVYWIYWVLETSP